MRQAQINRKTAETDIALTLNLDGSGNSTVDTGCGFLNHMLTLFAKHAKVDLSVSCKGDIEVDYHHTVEDIGIALGEAFNQAIADKKGICRFADCCLPMDEALIQCAMDISGRDYLGYALQLPTQKVGDFDTELVEEFFLAFVRNSKMCLHLRQLAGRNTHHIIEGAFKAFGICVRKAVAIDTRFSEDIPSTKGVI